MANPTADTVAFWITREITTDDFRPLLDLATEILIARLTAKSAEENAELAEQMLPQIVDSLDRMETESLEDGVEPNFKLSAEEGTAYIRARTSAALTFLDQLLALTPTQFEQFCARVLEKMGGNCTVTGRSGDGGIDFIARNLNLHSPTTIGARLFVVGQAKRYGRDNYIAEGELRSFVGGCIRKTTDPEDILTFRRAVLAPVAFAFWTTSDFQPSAKKYARAVGLWYLNGIGLAQLALRLEVPASLSPSD